MTATLFELVFQQIEEGINDGKPIGWKAPHPTTIATALNDPRIAADDIEFAMSALTQSGHLLRNEATGTYIINPAPPCSLVDVRALPAAAPELVIRRGPEWRQNAKGNWYAFAGNSQATVFRSKGTWRWCIKTTEWHDDAFNDAEAAMVEANRELISRQQQAEG